MHCLISDTNESNRLLKVRKRTRKRTRTKYSNCKTSNFNETDILKLPRKSDSIRKFQSTSMTSLIKLNTDQFKRSELDNDHDNDDNEDEEEDLEQMNEEDEHFVSAFNRLQNIYLGNIIMPTIISYNGKVQQSDLNSQSAKKLEAPIERFLVKSALNKSQRTSNNNNNKTTSTTYQEIRRKMSPSSSSIKLFLTTSLCLLLTSFKPNQIICQRSMSVSEPSIQFTSQSPLISPQNGNTNNYQAANERRVNDGIPQLKPQGNAIDQLMSILNSYQQSAMQNQNRRPILPFNNQRNISPVLQTSTPLNPFIGTQIQPYRQRQNSGFPNQQQQQQQQQPQVNQMTNTNQLFVPSSPATPYLTLNRIASLANNAQTMNNNNNGNNNNNNNNNQPQNSNLNTRSQLAPNLQPINTIPLGGASNNQQGRLPIGSRLIPQPQPTRGITPQRMPDQQNGQQQRPASMSLPMPPTIMVNPNPNQVKPISGFAPSGPPPNAAANNALVVVQSPTNAIGQLPQNQQQDLSDNNKTNSESINTTTSFAPTTTLNPTTPAVSDDSSIDTSSSSDDKQAQPSTPAVTFTTSLKPPLVESGSPTITPTNTDNQDNKQAISEQQQQPVTKESTSWNPVEGNRSELANRKAVSLSPSPDIVTVPPGYNPDNPNNQPQNYDIAVSAQMGTPVIQVQPQQQRQDSPTGSNKQQQQKVNSSLESSSVDQSASMIQHQQQHTSASTPIIPITAPTAITTITWSPPPSTTDTYSTISTTMVSSINRSTIQPTKSFDSTRVQPTASPTDSNQQQQQPPTRIRDNSLQQTQQSDEPMQRDQDLGVVYGKPPTRDSKPIAPSPVTNQANIETSVAGRPFIQPVQMDNQVRPFTAGAQQQAAANNNNNNNNAQQQTAYRSNHGHSTLNSSPSIQNPFLAGASFRGSRPLNGNQLPMSVGSGFTITANGNQTMPTGDIQDYVAGQPPPLLSLPSSSFQGPNNEPTISAQGGPDPASFDLSQQDTTINSQQQQARNSSTGDVTSAPIPSSSQTPPRIRRPTFKPKPAVPPIRIDSCIVGDDSSCDQSHNERCVTEYGISSCHCKPGYARLSQLRGYCSPVSSLQLNMKIDKLSDDRKLVFNHTLDNSNSEEYQYLEFETIQALASAFQQTQLAKQFMGARVNKFFDKKGKVWANVSVNFESNNMTKVENKIQQLAGQEMVKIINQSKSKPLGDSTIMLDGSKEALSRLQDINECSNKDLNDCSKFATCSNEFGGFQCQCLPGYEDKYINLEDKSKHGRVCLGCSASYCSNRGECSISDGQKHCKCRPNFIGSRCDIDSEVLAVAIGGSLVGIIILIITFWCLFVFNRRWKREQQKMDAMSATSGLTFNYVNSSTNSLMSPHTTARNMVGGGLHRSGGHQVGAMAANYGHRFSAALTGNGTRIGGGGGGGASNVIGGQHYSNDQQAIIGSTSSGSSASSQAIGCNPYAPAGGGGGAYQYEDGGLLIAPASTGSSEQTSPSSNSYRGIINGGNNINNTMLSQLAGNAYTLSGHHHHHHHNANSHHAHHAQQLHHHHHHHAKNQHHQLTQFNPAGAADYRTLNTTTALHYPAPNQYDARWRTLQDQRDKQSALVGYYLSPEMLINQQQHHHQQQHQQRY